VRDENAIEAFKADAALQDLPLGALAAVNQKAMLIVHHNLRGEAAMDGGGRSRSAEEEDFKQEVSGLTR